LNALALIELAAKLDHPAVDVDQHDLLEPLVLERFVGDRQVSAADDHHPLGLAVLQERQVGEHLGVGGFVARRDLEDVVEHQDAAVGDRVENLNFLVTAGFLRDHLGELQALRVAFVKPLAKHFGFFARHFAPRSYVSVRAS